jgi:hypothetical protein
MQGENTAYRDLSDVYIELMRNDHSFLAVRRNLKNILNYSYQLTQIMCVEYKNRTWNDLEPNRTKSSKSLSLLEL